MVGRLLVGFVWLNRQFSVSWQVDFQWGSCGLIQFSVSWLVDFQWGSCGSIFSFLFHGRQTFSGARVAQYLVFCVMVGRLLVGFVWLNLQFCVMVGIFLLGFVWFNLQFSVSCQVDFQWGSCGSIFSFLCHVRQTFSGVRVAQSLLFCVMVGRLLVGFVWLNLQSSMSWQVDFQWGSCGSIFSFLCHGMQTFSGFRVAQSLVFCVMVGRLLVGFVWLNLQFCVMIGRLLAGFVWLNLQFYVSWLIDFQCCSCGSIFSFLCHGWQIFSGIRVAQSLVFCVMVGRLLVGFVWLNLQFSVSQLVNFQWSSCGSIFSFLCHGWQTFSGVRVAQSLVFCVMVDRLLVGFVWLNLQFCVMVGIFLLGFVLLNLQYYVSWLVYFQWGSCSFFCVMVGRLLVGFVWLNAQSSISWQVNFQWGSCGSIFSFLCHGWQIFSGVRVAQSLVFCVMVGILLAGLVWLNLQFSVSWWVDFQWGSCGSIFSLLCHGRQTFSGVRVAQSLVFCVIVGRLLAGFVSLNLQFSVSWLVDFQWGSCGSIFSFVS